MQTSKNRHLMLGLLSALTLDAVVAHAATPAVSVAVPSPAQGSVSVVATAGRPRRLQRLEIQIDGTSVAACASTPCRYEWDTSSAGAGIHEVRATAILRGGARRTRRRNVEVTADDRGPVVVLNAPATATGAVTVVSSATGDDTIAKTRLLVDGQSVGEFPGASVQYRWDSRAVTNGSHRIEAVAIDSTGNSGSAARDVVVQNRATRPANDYTGPQVTLTMPTSVSGSVTLLTSATDPAGVAVMDLELDGTWLGEFPSDSFSYEWNSNDVSDGRHTFEVAAYDTSGNVAYASAEFTVHNYVTRPPTTTVPPTSDPIEILTGPLTRIGTETGVPSAARFDQAAVAKGRTYADAFPAFPDRIWDSNYYDLARVLYQMHYRTGDAYWRDRARAVARTWRDDPMNQQIEAYLAGNESLRGSLPPNRSMATLGLAIYALEMQDAEARKIVHMHARLAERALHWQDQRETGYGLMALVASTFLGDDHAANAKKLLDVILAAQKADGRWESPGGELVAVPFTLNYMTGILCEALILYDRVIGDARILPAILKSIDWTWSTQWLPAVKSFQYANLTAGTVNTDPAPVLSGLILPAWGYAFYKTGDTMYLEQGNQIFQGLADSGTAEIWSAKQYAQVYRSSASYLGFISLPR
ncbi:MAG: hypothetical protein QOD06_3026 [Candidatus Binatota bacterium]|nr:hypothetical protein [Candidatus Binatota bacterium]